MKKAFETVKNTRIANYNIRSIILEIKNDRCKIVKMLIFRYLYLEQFRKDNETLVF